MLDVFEQYASHADELNLTEEEAQTFLDFKTLDQDVRILFMFSLRPPVVAWLQKVSMLNDAYIFVCAHGNKFLSPCVQQAIRSLGGPYNGKGVDTAWPSGTLVIKEVREVQLALRPFFSTVRANEDVVDAVRTLYRCVPAVSDVHVLILERQLSRLALQHHLSNHPIPVDVDWPSYLNAMFGRIDPLFEIHDDVHHAYDPMRVRGTDFWPRLSSTLGCDGLVMSASAIELNFLRPSHDLQDRVPKTDWEAVALTPPVCITATLLLLLLDEVGTKLQQFGDLGAETLRVLRFAAKVCIVR